MKVLGTSTVWAVLVLATAIVSSGCTGSVECSVDQNMSGQKTVCNGTVFTYTLQGSPTGKTETYTWENEKGQARISAVYQGSGAVTVTVKDAAGKQMYSGQHAGSGQTAESTSATGQKGPWTIEIRVTALSGQVALSVTPNSPSAMP